MNSLWSRLILHFWALECERRISCKSAPDTVEFLQRAYEETLNSTNHWLGTTTSATALLYTATSNDTTSNNNNNNDIQKNAKPLLYVTNIGDCQIIVIRPNEGKILFKSREQWHWFDCPYQLGTNSVDQPLSNAVLNTLELAEDDIVLAVSDGVIDNLWDHEVLANVLESIEKWDSGDIGSWGAERATGSSSAGSMVFVARRLLHAALAVAQDPFAESPYMEKAIDEGLTIEGGLYFFLIIMTVRGLMSTGKMDDISVVIGQCKRR